ncbi:MAG TPA: cytochrome c peroxidase [Flavobacteriales bacterium]|nr:cytochrome c peroxidase [Flavobacteriales bacterium]
MKRLLILLCVCSTLFSSCKKDEDEPETPYQTTPYTLETPPGFPAMAIPADNPITVEGVALGRKLFYEKLLSGNNTQSCATCHNQALSFTDNGTRFSTGITGAVGTRNAQPLINLGYNLHYFWDGRAGTLEDQALGPVKNPIEMHLAWTEAAARLNANTSYKAEFKKAFNVDVIDSTHVVKALAQFMRTMISYNSKLDRRLRNEANLSSSELNGYVIYNTEKGDCFHCHSIDAGRLLTDNQFHNNGLDSIFTDLGRGAITGNPNDNGKFLTPTLRNIALTAPYMHDGRFQTLEQVIDHYNTGGKASSTVDPLMKHVGTGLNLTSQEKADLLAFLRSMTDSTFINDTRFKSPF